jgi:hypothetical protein
MKEYSLETVMSFGKYNGSTTKEIIELDPSYISWTILNIEHLYLDENSIKYLQNKSNILDKILEVNKEKMNEDLESQNYSYSYQSDYYNDYTSVDSNPNYNDNLDMDQQSQEFWESL